MKISPEHIELINAYGPYNHAVWKSNEIDISNEERLSGRGNFLVNQIKKCILDNYSTEDMKKLSILDVGCYDGWILHKLSDLPFYRMVGVEPREKNIQKGEKVREILNIKTRVEFIKGSAETLDLEDHFDIVICVGVLHHVESIPLVLRNLTKICKKMLFIETACLSSKFITKNFRKEIEMKDVVYQFKGKICGITGQKYESAYYDGSTESFSVVSIPSVESLRMYLDTFGFGNINIVSSPDEYWRFVLKKSGRNVNAICLCAFSEKDACSSLQEHDWIKEYEEGLFRTVIDKRYIEPLYKKFCLNRSSSRLPFASVNIFLYIKASQRLALIFEFINNKLFTNRFEQEIIRNLKYNTADKLALEMGKIFYFEKKYHEAISVLLSITQKINSDWRAVYRAFYLLHLIYNDINCSDEAVRYRKLYLTCNPNFPL